MNVRERLTLFQQECGISNYALERMLGVSNGYMGKCKNPSADVLETLLRTYPDLSAEWLMRGEGEMYRLDAAIEKAGGADMPPVTDDELDAKIESAVEKKLKQLLMKA